MKKAIYKITNKVNNKSYIGQSIHPEERFKAHCYRHEKYKSMINDAIIKYGVNNFVFEILGWFEDYNEKEKFYIQYYRTLAPYGYNIAKGGEEPPTGTGENNSFAKLTNKEAEEIKQELLNWLIPRKQITKKHHLTEDMIRHINDGTSWHDDKLTYPLRPKESELNERRADKVIELLKTTNLSHAAIGKMVGWNRSAITMINNGKNHYRSDIIYPIRSGRHYETCND